MEYYKCMNPDTGMVYRIHRRYTDRDGTLTLEKLDGKKWVDAPELLDATSIGEAHNCFPMSEEEIACIEELTRSEEVRATLLQRIKTGLAAFDEEDDLFVYTDAKSVMPSGAKADSVSTNGEDKSSL